LLTGAQLSEYLRLDFKSFDQTLPDGGWRGLENRGCSLEATKLVEIYHLHHLGELEPWQTRILYWHAGQVYAMQDLSDLALARFKKSFDPEEKPEDNLKWNSYVRGSIAFLEHNLDQLIKARDELRAANKVNPNPNLKFLEAFVRCFKKSYKEAYNPDCN
jgi:hypothetical protein